MAVTRREQQMLDLADTGLSPSRIATEMGVQSDSVRRALNLLTVNLSDDRRREAAIARGSAELLQALRRAGHC